MPRLMRLTKNRWNRIRFPYKLMLIYIPLIIGPALLSMYYLTNNYAKESKESRVAYTTSLLHMMGQTLDNQIQAFENISRQIMTDSEIMELATKQVESAYDKILIENAINRKLNTIWLNAVNNHYIKAIIIASDFRIFSYGKSALDNYDVLAESYKSKTDLSKGAAVWFEPQHFSDGFVQAPSFRLARAIRDDKLRHLGQLTLVIDAKLIEDQFDSISAQHIPIKLLDADGHALLANNTEASDHGKQTEMYTYELASTGWTLSADLPLEEMYASIYATVKKAALLIFICLLIGLIVTHLLVTDLVIPIRKLLRNMKQSIRGVKPGQLQRFGGAIEIVEMNDTLISLMYEIENLIHEKTMHEQKKKLAELRALQQQLSPHFLYNTLNSIRWMAIIQKQDNIKEMLDALNRLLAYGLRGDEKQLVPMDKDFAILDDYVKIQRVRYQHFELIYHIPEQLKSLPIPKFLLQPLIENSLIHGLAASGRPGVIAISAIRQQDKVEMTITDNGIGINEDTLLQLQSRRQAKDNHFGFHSVRERIQLHYGEQYDVQIESKEQQGTIVTLQIPIQESDSKCER